MAVIRAYDQDGNINYEETNAAIQAGAIDWIGQGRLIQASAADIRYFSREDGTFVLQTTYNLGGNDDAFGICYNRGVGLDDTPQWEGCDGAEIVISVSNLRLGATGLGFGLYTPTFQQVKQILTVPPANPQPLSYRGICTDGHHFYLSMDTGNFNNGLKIQRWELTGNVFNFQKQWTAGNITPYYQDLCFDGSNVWAVDDGILDRLTIENDSTSVIVDKTIAISGTNAYGVTFDGNMFWVVTDD